MRKINLNQLKQGISGITATYGEFLWETLVYCLVKMGHESGVHLVVLGNKKTKLELTWSGKLNKEVAATYNDELDLAEYGATAMAILLVLKLTDYTYLKRAQKGSRGDYWLGKKDEQGVLILDGLLEISGILKETKNNRLSKRFREKEIQVKLSPYQSVSKNIVVVEFSTPKTKVQL